MRIGFLGTGAANGVPAFYCGCVACEEAFGDPSAERTRCSLMIQGSTNTLIDASPDLRHQLLRERIDSIDGLLLTHTHFDHAGGLPELEFYVRMRRKEPLPAVMTLESAEWVHATLGYMTDCLEIKTVQPGESFRFGGVAYTALAVTHCEGALGFLMEGASGYRVAYLPDTGPLPPETLSLVSGVDMLIVGATFFGDNWMPEDHLSVDEAIDLGQRLHAESMYLTHLSMHYDRAVTVKMLEEYIRGVGGTNVQAAHDGMWITINDR